MLDVGFDDLVQRERRRRVRRMIGIGTAAMVTIAALTAFWFDRQRAIGRQEQINVAQALANEALEQRTAVDPSLSALLAVESLRIAPTPDGLSAAVGSLAMLPRRIGEFRHDGRVTFLSFARDKATLASGATTGPGPGDRSTIRLWDLATARQLSEVVQDDVLRPDMLAVSPDNTLLATASYPRNVRVSDLRSGTERYRLSHEPSIGSVMFGGSRTWIATSGGGTFRMWNAGSGTLLAQFSGIGASGTAAAAAVSEDESRIAASASDTVVWNVDTGATIARLPHAAQHLAFAGSDRLVTANEDSAQLWDLSTSSPLSRLDYRQRFAGVAAVALNRGGTRLGTASGNTVSIWDIANRKEIGRLPHSSFVAGLAFSHDGLRLATGTDDGVVRVWDTTPKLGDEGGVFAISMTADGSRMATAAKPGALSSPSGSEARGIETLSPDGRLLAAARGGIGTEPDAVVVTDAATGKELCRLPHAVAVRRMAFSAGGELLVTQSGNAIAFWQMPAGQKARNFQSDDEVESFGMSRDGRHLAIGTANTVDLWNAQTGQKRSTLSFKAIVKAIAFSGDSMLLATMSGSGVRVWDAETGNPRSVLPHDDFVGGVSFDSADHDVLTFSRRDANIWRQGTTDRLRLPHDEDVVDAAFDSTGQHVATLTKSAVHLWDAAAGREIGRLPVDEELASVAFSANDRFVVAGGGGRLVRVFPWRAEDLIGEVCSRLTHNLTPSQWTTYFRDQPYRPTCPNVTAGTRP
jgi:WD40 repeat protein